MEELYLNCKTAGCNAKIVSPIQVPKEMLEQINLEDTSIECPICGASHVYGKEDILVGKK